MGKSQIGDHYIKSKLDIDLSNLNHVNEFVPAIKGEKIESQSILSKALRKSKKITARIVFERSIESRTIENVCNIVDFVTAVNWFSPVITCKVYTYKF